MTDDPVVSFGAAKPLASYSGGGNVPKTAMYTTLSNNMFTRWPNEHFQKKACNSTLKRYTDLIKITIINYIIITSIIWAQIE